MIIWNIKIKVRFWLLYMFVWSWRGAAVNCVMGCHTMTRGSIPSWDGVKTELHVLRKGKWMGSPSLNDLAVDGTLNTTNQLYVFVCVTFPSLLTSVVILWLCPLVEGVRTTTFLKCCHTEMSLCGHNTWHPNPSLNKEYTLISHPWSKCFWPLNYCGDFEMWIHYLEYLQLNMKNDHWKYEVSQHEKNTKCILSESKFTFICMNKCKVHSSVCLHGMFRSWFEKKRFRFINV